ncbi:flavocytochrome c [Clostridiisalibacter paucivorans]|uniref:flavocytochrome c n=1 Tax=Clostridiisalibacter paucivorans TaxID=408753 RepID=UPI00047AF4EE|nr:flavocytochrome c [Clostridiisalibacter paucivorans]
MYKIKRISLLLFVIIISMAMVACGSPNETTSGENGVNGSFVGEAEGHNGKIKLNVTVENSEISKIDIVENSESEFTKEVFDKLFKSIISKNSTEIDTVSGATVTSEAVVIAVNDAIEKAGITLTPKKVSEKDAEVKDVSTDIVVIGGGGAGLTAAIEAKENDADVILVEKNAFVGGNTNLATGGLNAAETKYQSENGIEDSAELFFEDTMKGGKNKNNPELVKILTEKSAETVDWLTEKGVDLTDVGVAGGASVERIHRPTGGAAIGAHLVETLEKKAKELGVDIRVSTKAIEILNDEGKATGIKVEDENGNPYNINAKAVIIATGGFGADQEKVVEFKPELKGFGTTNAPVATGDALNLVKSFNAELVDINEIQTHPTVVPEKNKMITEAVRGNGAILINRDAKRFIDELETRDVVSAAELEQEGQTAFLIFDQNVRESLKAIEGYHKAGLLIEADSVEELGKAIDINGTELKNTIDTYNSYVNNGKDKDFNRENMKTELNKAPFYAVEVGPAVHHTMGGLKINTEAQVISKSGEIIEGLFAAGEVTGGIHGANRLGGNALSDITTFGRIAGKNAASLVK